MESILVLGAFVDIVNGLLYTIFTLSALFLVFIILMQEGKGGGLGEAFGGAGAETFGPRVGGINKFTATIALVFVVSTLGIHRLNRPASFDVPKAEIVADLRESTNDGTTSPTPDFGAPDFPNPGTDAIPPTSVSDTDLTRSALEGFVPAGASDESSVSTPGTAPGGTGAEGTEGASAPPGSADPYAEFGSVGPDLFTKPAAAAAGTGAGEEGGGQDG